MQTAMEWLKSQIISMVQNGADLGEDLPALMQHIAKAKEMESLNNDILLATIRNKDREIKALGYRIYSLRYAVKQGHQIR